MKVEATVHSTRDTVRVQYVERLGEEHVNICQGGYEDDGCDGDRSPCPYEHESITIPEYGPPLVRSELMPRSEWHDDEGVTEFAHRILGPPSVIEPAGPHVRRKFRDLAASVTATPEGRARVDELRHNMEPSVHRTTRADVSPEVLSLLDELRRNLDAMISDEELDDMIATDPPETAAVLTELRNSRANLRAVLDG